jgi:ATP-dependent Zn protease
VGNPGALTAATNIVTLVKGIKQARRGGHLLRGLLLVGASGSGKRYLAQAIATEAGIPIGYLNASSLAASRIGLGQIKVVMLYRKARKMAREYGACLLFIEDIQALNEHTGILHELLVQVAPPFRSRSWWHWFDLGSISMRGNSTPAVLTVATTSRLEAVHAALLKPGYFDRQIVIGLPDAAGRRDIIAHYLQHLQQVAHEQLPLDRMAADTAGYSPALIRRILHEAQVYAYMDGRRAITYADFVQSHALRTAKALPSDRELSARSHEMQRRTAYYQAGRVYARVKLGRSPTGDGRPLSRAELLADMQVMLAGRAAEESLLGMQTTAAIDDLREATQQARLMVERLGMAAEGLSLPGSQQHMQVEALVQQHYAQVRDVLTHNRHAVTMLAEALILHEDLSELDIHALLVQMEAQYPFTCPSALQPTPVLVARRLPISSEPEPVPTRRFVEPEPALPDDMTPHPEPSSEPEPSDSDEDDNDGF